MAEGQGQVSPKGVPRPPQGDTSTFLQRVAARLYSIPVVEHAADQVILAGEKVAEVRDSTVRNATRGIKFGLLAGPTILIILVGLYAFMMLGGPALFRRR